MVTKDQDKVDHANKRIALFTAQLEESNPVLTEISDAMTAEGALWFYSRRCNQPIVRVHSVCRCGACGRRDVAVCACRCLAHVRVCMLRAWLCVHSNVFFKSAFAFGLDVA